MILQRIIEQKQKEISALKGRTFEKRAFPLRRLSSHLQGKHNIIAEIKKASPSAGILRHDLDIPSLVRAYEPYASAISVVTDGSFFAGNLGMIADVKKTTSLPVLRKDFILDEAQINESYAAGADAVLLIARLLSREQMKQLMQRTHERGMECIVEVHTPEDVERALTCGALMIGINNRDLDTFAVDLETTARLKKIIPADVIVVSESGFQTIDEIIAADTHAVLIGTHLLQSNDVASTLQAMRRTKVKICGITSRADALSAVAAGADFLGFNFYPKSPRFIAPEHAKEIIAALPNTVGCVGIFVHGSEESVLRIATISGIDMIQYYGALPNLTLPLPVIVSYGVDHALPNIDDAEAFGYLFDTHDPDLHGGTGRRFDHHLLHGFKKDFRKKLFVAGGLTAENGGDVICMLDPFCVDICSGVEKSPGIKDEAKMKACVAAAKKASDDCQKVKA